jgi:hypothetical protein
MDSMSHAGAYGRLKLLEDTVDASSAARFYGESAKTETLEQAVVHRRLLAVQCVKGELRFPVWQFRPGGGVVAGLERVLDALSGTMAADDMGALAFFLNPNPLTGGIPPIEALRAGRIEAVIRAAIDARF